MYLTFFGELIIRTKTIWANITSKQISTLLFLFTLMLSLILGLNGGNLFSSDAYAYFYSIKLLAETYRLFSPTPVPYFIEVSGAYFSPYPLGYSLLSVPFYLVFKITAGSETLGPRFMNMLIFSLSVYFTSEFANDLKNKALGLLSACILIFGTFAIEQTAHIWSHIPSMFFILLTIRYLYLYEKQGNMINLYISSISSGIAFWIRYFNIMLIVVVFFYLIIKYRQQVRAYLSFPIIFLMLISPALLYHQIYFGNAFTTPYAYHPLQQSFKQFDILFLRYTIWYMLVEYQPYPVAYTPAAYFHSSLLESAPSLILAIPGFYLLYRESKEFFLMLLAYFWIIVLFFGMFESWDGGWCLSMRLLTDTLPFLSIASGKYIQYQIKRLQNDKSITISIVIGSIIIVILFLILLTIDFYQTIVITRRIAVNQISRYIVGSLASFIGVLLFVNIKKKKEVEEILITLFFALVLLAVAWALFLNIGLNIVTWTSGGNRVLPILDWIITILKLPGYDDRYTQSITNYPLYLTIFSITIALFIFNIFYLLKKEQIKRIMKYRL